MRRPRPAVHSGRKPAAAAGKPETSAARSATADSQQPGQPRPGKQPPRPRRRKRRARRRLSPAMAWTLLVMLVVVAYVGYWGFSAYLLKRGLETVIAAQQAEGITILHGPARLTGFPLRVSATLTDIEARATPERGGWTWATDRITLSILPHQPRTIRIALDEAPHAIMLPESPAPVTFSARAESGTLIVTHAGSGRLREASLSLEGADIASVAGPGAGGPSHTIGSLSATLTHHPHWDPGPRDITHSVSLDLNQLTLAPNPRVPLGRTIETIRLRADVLGDLPHEGPPSTALRAWRDGDGRLRINDMAVTWPPLDLRAAGSLGLDTALQPEGTANARISGFLTAIDTLREQDLVRGRDATMAKILLGGMAHRSQDGRLTLQVPLIARDGALWAGPVMLMPLPRLPWGPPPGTLGAEGVRPGFTIDNQGNVVPNQ